MSWHFSQALAEGFSQANCSDGKLFAPLKSTTTREAYCWRDKTMEPLDLFQFGMTLEHSTAQLGEDVLMWCRAGSPARTSALRGQCGDAPGSMEKKAGSGVNTCESSTNAARGLCGEKTPQPSKTKDSPTSFERFPSAGMFAGGRLSGLSIAGYRTSGNAYGFTLPTPTARDWKDTIGMSPTRKDGKTRTDRLPMLLFSVVRSAGIDCQATTLTDAQIVALKGLAVTIKGREYSPELPEWLMAWPIGWTDLRPLGMDKFQSWLQQHGAS